MKKTKKIITRTASELAEALGLSPADGAEIEVRSDLNDKIVDVLQAKKPPYFQFPDLGF